MTTKPRLDLESTWRLVDEQRAVFSDLVAPLDERQLSTPSLCHAWTVRDVVAHLALAQMGPATAVREVLRARGRFDVMVRDTALRRSRRTTVADDVRVIRAMAGTRRTAPMVTPMEPLVDALVHTQDVARPLGVDVPMPRDAAVAAAQRVWSMGFPFWAARRLRGARLVALDADWTVESGRVERVVEAPVADLLLLVTGRSQESASPDR